MQELATTPDARISQYSFGQSISQFGVTVYSCKSAREGKKIFGNDPDPTTEIMVETQDDIISAHIKDNPNGKVAGYEDIIRECGHTYQVHYRTVSFGSTWKSCSLKPAGYSIVYHNGAHTNFRFPGINRLTSLESGGLAACSGFDSKVATGRKIHFIKETDSFTPHSIGSIIVPMHDCWYHKTLLRQHYPFPISDTTTIQLTVDKPTVIVEFYQGEPDVSEFTKLWLNQIEDGLIEIVTR
jgi:hypothetical protein|tara:strand:- start:408 stop:1127 length:720 start_codon:yes stop_codon:yes gene_type:complete